MRTANEGARTNALSVLARAPECDALEGISTVTVLCTPAARLPGR